MEAYGRFSNEFDPLRFEQMVNVYKCYIKLGNKEQIEKMRDSVLKIANQLLAEGSTQLKELEAL